MWSEKLSNGKVRFVERYTDPFTEKEKRVKVTMDKDTNATRKKAQAILQEKIRSRLRLEHDDSTHQRLTLEELCDLYIKEQKNILKASTVRRNEFMCKNSLKIWGADTLVDKLSANYLRSKLLETGRSAKYMNENLKRFKVVLHWGYKHNYINDIGYLKKIERFKEDIPRKASIKNKYLEADELAMLLDYMDHDVWHLTAKFLALSGLRFGEFSALLKTDVDIEKRVIHVTKNFDPNNLVTTSPKNISSYRDVFMQDELLEVAVAINELMDKYRDALGVQNSLFVFDLDGSNVKYYAFNKYLKENAEKCLERDVRVTPHVLRHTHASLLAEKGIDYESIARRLGHSDSTITREIYIHITNERIKKENEAIKGLHLI